MPMIGGVTRQDGDWALSRMFVFMMIAAHCQSHLNTCAQYSKNSSRIPSEYYSSYLEALGLVNDTDFLTYNLTSFLTSVYGKWIIVRL